MTTASKKQPNQGIQPAVTQQQSAAQAVETRFHREMDRSASTERTRVCAEVKAWVHSISSSYSSLGVARAELYPSQFWLLEGERQINALECMMERLLERRHRRMLVSAISRMITQGIVQADLAAHRHTRFTSEVLIPSLLSMVASFGIVRGVLLVGDLLGMPGSSTVWTGASLLLGLMFFCTVIAVRWRQRRHRIAQQHQTSLVAHIQDVTDRILYSYYATTHKRSEGPLMDAEEAQQVFQAASDALHSQQCAFNDVLSEGSGQQRLAAGVFRVTQSPYALQNQPRETIPANPRAAYPPRRVTSMRQSLHKPDSSERMAAKSTSAVHSASESSPVTTVNTEGRK